MGKKFHPENVILNVTFESQSNEFRKQILLDRP